MGYRNRDRSYENGRRVIFADHERPPMRCLYITVFICTAALALLRPHPARAQSGAGSQDTSGTLRPRYGSYLIQTFPSPAKSTAQITIQFYNHNDEVLMCQVFDAADRLVHVVQPKQMTAGGLHTFLIPASSLSSGMYFIRLTTFTASDNEDVVDNTRFLIIH
ncbi:MAG TPA: T9SS type A sorting domain-containing protein [Candidatus Kapabacteria bacterium]|jgi:hypothetical protein|nr:T9SS type A sorting domain-containing protein [Candidatus Kapabacteria bacterium]